MEKVVILKRSTLLSSSNIFSIKEVLLIKVVMNS
jgi:hypothetical protein